MFNSEEQIERNYDERRNIFEKTEKKEPENVAKQSRQVRKEPQLRLSTLHTSASSSPWKPTRTGVLDPLVLSVAKRKGQDSL